MNLNEAIINNLRESEEGYVISTYERENSGYIARDGEGYIIAPTKEEAIKYSSEEEAESNKEDINQFFGGKAKLVVSRA